MKKLIAIATLALSLNAFSASFVGTTLLPTQSLALSSISTSGNVQKEAAQVINDSQELIQSGKMTAFLGQKIKDIQAQDSAVSDSDALDALLSVSDQILK
ncbi:MAG: hypothetical protein PHY93_00460 [Bacteriovorax sp.]|nr:hypothetical protein [Bacteriovorax sp.]